MADWFYIGYCTVMAMFAVAAAYAAAFGFRALRRLPRSLLLGFAAAAVVATLTAQKTNNVPPNMNSPLPQMMQGGGSFQTGFTGLTGFLGEGNLVNLVNPVQTTNVDIARGWHIEGVVTNATISYAMPTNATLVGNFHVHGAASSFGNNVVDFGVLRTSGTLVPTNWSFPLGTNDEAFSSFWYFIDGRIRPTPRDAAHEICAVGAPMTAVPGQSRLWRLDDDDGSRILTWENFFLGGDTNCPINAQIVLFPNGDFLTRSNDVETVCRRVNPDDWDDDGIPNERDANPTSYDGDFFGVANGLPPNANPDAYYWLDLSVTGALGVATIRVTCDGASDLGDHVIIVRTNQVCHIPILAGATYAVDSNLPIDYSAVSSEYAEIVTNAENHLTVSLPLELIFERVLMRGGSNTYIAHTTPVDIGPRILNIAGGCCSCVTNEAGFSWVCDAECCCAGCMHTLYCSLFCEGYSRALMSELRCPCATEEDDENGACVNIAFSDTVVVFETQYTNAPGVVVSRRSTSTTLTCRVMGGEYGGNVVVSLSNGAKILRTSGDVLPGSASVAAGEETLLSAAFEGLSESVAVGDIVGTAVFTENMTGRQLTSRTSLTSIKVSVVADAMSPTNRVRHVFGPQETATLQAVPVHGEAKWHVGGTNVVGSSCRYAAPNAPTNTIASFSAATVVFPFDLSVIAPTELNATSWWSATPNEWVAMTGSSPVPGEIAVGLRTSLRLLPDYVSFMHLYLQEGECEASGIWGFFEPYANSLLPHDANAGAWNEVGVSSIDNAAGDDFAGTSFGTIPIALAAGGFEYAITNYWYVKNGAAVIGTPQPFLIEHQVFSLTSGGDLSVEKYRCTATRGTNGVTIVTRRP